MEIRRVTFMDNYKEVEHLFVENHAETGLDLPLNLNFEAYKALEDLDMLVNLILFDDGKVVGYLNAFISENPHYVGYKMAAIDSCFISKNYRKTVSLKGVKMLFSEMESILEKEYAVKSISFSFSVKKDLTNLTKRLGYSPYNIAVMKVL